MTFNKIFKISFKPSETNYDMTALFLQEDEDADTMSTPPYSRTSSDLNMYADFFPEITDFDTTVIIENQRYHTMHKTFAKNVSDH